jgi:hypothetical protein
MKLRAVRWTRIVARTGNMRNAYPALVGKLEWTRLLGIPGNNREDNINMHPKERSFGSGYGPVVGFCEFDNEPSGSIKQGGREISGRRQRL